MWFMVASWFVEYTMCDTPTTGHSQHTQYFNTGTIDIHSNYNSGTDIHSTITQVIQTFIVP